MFHRRKLPVLLLLCMVFAFSFPVCSINADTAGADAGDALRSPAEPSRKKVFAEQISSINNRIRITQDIQQPAAVDFRNFYADSTGIIKGVLFKFTGSEYNGGLTFSVNGTSYTVTSVPDADTGYIYEDISSENIPSSYVKDIVINFNGNTQTVPAKPVTIRESSDEWIASPDGYTLYYYMGTDADIVVPNFYNNKPITTIGGALNEKDEYESIMDQNAFTAINSVTLSEGIRTIGYYAFYKTEITEINFNSDLINICDCAFANCEKLTAALSLPSGLEYLGTYAFYCCTNLQGGVTIPGGVDVVGKATFYECNSMSGPLVLEEGITDIGVLAFGSSKSTSGFTSVSFPSTLKRIGPYSFQNCTHISTITLPEGLETISDGAFDHVSGLTDEKMVIPSTVRTIGGDYLMDENGNLRDENTGYGGHVFYDLGRNETFRAFEVAEGNENFTAVDGVLYSKDMTRMLAYPRGKTDTVFEVPEGITQIDEMGFSRAHFLKEVILPDSLEIKPTVPENILNQDANTLSAALYVYTTVEKVSVKDSNTRYTSVDGLVYSKDKKSLWYIPTAYAGDINIPEGTERIERGSVFTAAINGWTKINIPSAVNYIDKTAMEYFNDMLNGIVTFRNNNNFGADKTGKFFRKGDLNSDSVVDDTDAKILMKHISGIALSEEESQNLNLCAADFNGNCETDLLDVIRILQI